ncbi:hypothetical protein EDC24_2103 [Aquisalibacillus elongatus]|uniref:Uncharacterized protein n=1 Tax=Aquisalibacillus elongatus TaxID=485577 RepID=A0A3N5B468_9BACI|nr:hypothetical protein EDC24_2103 [Aquisalibacillus elongatus]
MFKFVTWVLLIGGAFIFNLLGLMNLVPKFISIPFLFLTFFLFFYFILQRNSFKRFK